MRSATDALKRFGDVSHVEVLPGLQLVVSAVFFDVRAAARAQSALGPDSCKPAAQTGSRSVRLPGNVQLDIEKTRGVSKVMPEPDDSGAFLVEFYDLRDAQRAKELAEQSSGMLGARSLAKNNSEEVAAKAAPEASVPAYVKPSHSFAAPATSGCGLSQQANVLMRGLPKALCTSLCLEAMFEQAGLEGTIVNCRVRRGAYSSEVLLALSSRQAARRCIQHFHGRVWSNSGESVTAVFAKVNGRNGKSALDQPLLMPQKAPLPEDVEAEAAEAEAMNSTTPSSPISPLLEAPPGLCPPMKMERARPMEATSREKLAAGRKEERSPSLATDESTADGASVASEQEEVEALAPVAGVAA